MIDGDIVGMQRQRKGILGERDHMQKGMEKGVDPTGVGSDKLETKRGQIPKHLHD